MSLSDLHIHSSPHHRLRSSSSNYRLNNGDEGFSTAPDLSSANWNQWTHHGMSPEASHTSHSFAHDPFDQLMEENTFPDEFGCLPSVAPEEQRPYQPGLGLDMEVDFGTHAAEQDEFGVPHDDVGSLGGRARTRLQSRSSKSINVHSSSSNPYPTSSPSSPGRSRSGSFRVQIPNSLSLASGQSSPGSAFFPGGLPSPFRQPSTPSSATMDPAHSVRSSSPSDTSSVSGVAMSRMGSSSAASSVYGGEAGGPATPYRSTPSSSGRAKHQSHSRRPSSPIKGGRNAKKLTDLDRKAICVYQRAHPTTKQDDIGARFGVERSTVSKILKLKDKWLAIPSDDEEDDLSAAFTGTLFPSASSTSNDFVSPNATPDPAGLTPQQSPPPPTPVAPSSSTMPSTSTFYLKTSSTPLISGGRYPQIDNELNSWARQQAAFALLEDETLQAKARELAQSIKGCEGFKASHTWLDGFKHRAGIASGTFLDMLSPNSRGRVKAEEAASVLTEEDEPEEDRDDGDFEERSTRGTRTKRQQALSARRDSSRPSTAVPSSAAKMEVDSRTPLKPAFGDQDEATPTHSTVHSRATSAAAEQRMFDAMYRYSPTQRADDQQPQQRQQTTITRSSTMPLGGGHQSVHSTPSRQSSTHASPNPMSMSNYSPPEGSASGYANYNFGDGNSLTTSYSTNDLTSYPLQSPFQTSSSQSSFGQYAAAPSGSGHNSPAPSYQHGRSGSTASTTSSYSGLTAFSSQNGTGTPHTGSLYGSFPNSQSNPNSVPTTPSGGTGYFGHGPDGTQSQLQAAFVTGQQHPTSPFPSYIQTAQPARRATISGGVPFGSRQAQGGSALDPSSRNNSLQGQQQLTPSSPTKQSVSLEQARASLETAFDYLKSAEAQGFAEPKDLLIIWELKEKMAAAHKKQQQQGGGSSSATTPTIPSAASSNPFQQQNGGAFSFPAKKQHRLKLGRTQSLYGMGSRRDSATVSLFDSSMGVAEEHR